MNTEKEFLEAAIADRCESMKELIQEGGEVGQVEYDGAPERLTKRPARHPVLVMLLARLAVATSWQGKGLGSGLLQDAYSRTLQAAGIAGIQAFAVHAKDDDAKAFYMPFDFLPSPSDPYHLFRFLKDVRAKLASDKTASGKE